MRSCVPLLLLFILRIECSVLNCDEGVLGQVCKNGSRLTNFLSVPAPFPAKINLTLNIIDIFALDEEAQTITMQMKLTIQWTDKRLGVVRSSPYEIEK